MLDHFDEGELTTISFSNSPPMPPERRQNTRHVTVLRVAKLQTVRSEELCLVRNISAGGLMAHIYSELNIGEPVTAEFKSGQSVSGRVLWRREGLAGIQFNETVNASRLLADSHDYSTSSQQPRAPRVGVDVRARVRVGAHYHSVKMCNISQSGGRISPGAQFESGQKLVLMLTGLPPIAGCVRWTNKDHAGIAFDNPIAFEVLARWVPTMQAQARERQLEAPSEVAQELRA